jgi:hypothetical protein
MMKEYLLNFEKLLWVVVVVENGVEWKVNKRWKARGVRETFKYASQDLE